MGFIAFIIIGLIAGLIARAIMPGRQHMGLLATTLLGMVGSILGGIIGSLVGPHHDFAFRPSGIILSIIGAFIVLLLMGAAGHRRRAVV